MANIANVIELFGKLDRGETGEFTSDHRDILGWYFLSLGYQYPTRKKTSLREKQFRAKVENGQVVRLDQGRGPAVVWMIGQERAEALVLMCHEVGERENWYRIGKNDGTRGRGLQQAAADILGYALLNPSDHPEEFLRRLRRRVWAGIIRRPRDLDPDAVTALYSQIYGQKPNRNTASVPPGTIVELLRWLLQL